MTIAAAMAVDALAPLLKGMEITSDTWLAFRQSLRNTIMQIQTYQDLCTLQIPTVLVHGKLDFFVIKRNLKHIARVNRRFMTYKSMLGPHEITPLQGKIIANLLQS